jgi:glucose-1-phosphate cytidylyltransferase
VKAVILAGGFGTRISEESYLVPKPMVEIGGRPLLWHIMKIYATHGITEFIVCCGYKSHVIKEFFANYLLHTSNVTVDLKHNTIDYHSHPTEPWKVTLVETGLTTMTGGRLKMVKEYVDGKDFCFTYGDGVADIDIRKLIRSHEKSGKLATVTSVQPPARFGALVLEGNKVKSFQEKPQGEGWVSGGFFVLSPKVMDYINGSDTVWEREPLERLASEGQLSSYAHTGFWQPMDSLRDKTHLEELWDSGKAPWKVW